MKMIQTQKSHAIHATLGIICLAATACAAQAPQGITISKENRTIAITATDSVVAMADVATVHIGFVAYGPDHDSAYAAGSKTSNAVIAALKSAGVPADAIESEAQNLAEEQPYQLNQISRSRPAQPQVDAHPELDRPRQRRPTQPASSTSPSRPEPTRAAASTGASKTKTSRKPKPPAKPCNEPTP